MGGLRQHGLVCLVAIVVALPQNARTLARRVSTYVQAYQQAFITLVADEETTQTAMTGHGVIATRTTAGELFSTFVDASGTWMSVHDIAIVDGAPATDRESVRELLMRSSLAAIGPRLAASNARFNIGTVTRNFNEPTLALLLFTPARLDDLSVTVERGTSTEPGMMTLRFRSRGDAPLVRSLNGRVTASGTIAFDEESGRVQQTVVTFADGVVDATLHTTYAHDPHFDQWVPSRFVEHYAARRTGDTTDVVSIFTNYRRFDTHGRVITEP